MNAQAVKILYSRFSPRTARCLQRLNLSRRADILTAINNRTLHPSNVQALGFGKKSLDEVRTWLGLRPILSDMKICHLRSRIASALREQGYATDEVQRIMRFPGREKTRQHIAKGNRLRGVKAEGFI